MASKVNAPIKVIQQQSEDEVFTSTDENEPQAHDVRKYEVRDTAYRVARRWRISEVAALELMMNFEMQQSDTGFMLA
jgi:hypothetical protein